MRMDAMENISNTFARDTKTFNYNLEIIVKINLGQSMSRLFNE